MSEMRAPSPFPPAGSGEVFLTEGGTETEMLYRHGFELPKFCMLPLLDDPRAMEVLRDLFRAQLDVAAELGLSMMLTGLDYRASPDWGAKLGYSPPALAEANRHAIAFLKDLAREYDGQIPRILIGGIIGPRGDAYGLNRGITETSAEDYDAVQPATLEAVGADFACAMTFNSVPEAVGVARSAGRI